MGLRLVGRLMVRVSALTAPSVGITDGRQVPTQRWLLFGGRSLMTFSSSPVPLENLESYERMEVIFPFIILGDAHFSHDTPRNFVLDVPFTCCSPARELGSTPPNWRASEVRCKTPETNLAGVAA
jgi:hypothetical protein